MHSFPQHRSLTSTISRVQSSYDANAISCEVYVYEYENSYEIKSDYTKTSGILGIRCGR